MAWYHQSFTFLVTLLLGAEVEVEHLKCHDCDSYANGTCGVNLKSEGGVPCKYAGSTQCIREILQPIGKKPARCKLKLNHCVVVTRTQACTRHAL